MFILFNLRFWLLIDSHYRRTREFIASLILLNTNTNNNKNTISLVIDNKFHVWMGDRLLSSCPWTSNASSEQFHRVCCHQRDRHYEKMWERGRMSK
jgi:hypothetical protein